MPAQKTKTQEIVELVKGGGHRIESWPCKRGVRYELKAWRESQGFWTKVTASPMALRLAAAQLHGQYMVNLGSMHYTAGDAK